MNAVAQFLPSGTIYFVVHFYDAVSRYVLLCDVVGKTDEWWFRSSRN